MKDVCCCCFSLWSSDNTLRSGPAALFIVLLTHNRERRECNASIDTSQIPGRPPRSAPTISLLTSRPPLWSGRHFSPPNLTLFAGKNCPTMRVCYIVLPKKNEPSNVCQFKRSKIKNIQVSLIKTVNQDKNCSYQLKPVATHFKTYKNTCFIHLSKIILKSKAIYDWNHLSNFKLSLNGG
jgi:hypothetical protein